MTQRETLQDFLHAWGKPGRPKRGACCPVVREAFEFVKLTPEEEARLGVAYACAACLAGPAEPEMPDVVRDLCVLIDRERDRRIDGGFAFAGARFQSRPSDRENIMGAAQLGMAWMGAGGDPDTLRWSNPAADFAWITEDNTTMPMSASAVVALFQAGVAFKSALTFFARDLKDAVIAAADPSSIDIEAGWPV